MIAKSRYASFRIQEGKKIKELAENLNSGLVEPIAILPNNGVIFEIGEENGGVYVKCLPC
jgi:argonaute-like protein implicated in RNA metabolism and viral defense